VIVSAAADRRDEIRRFADEQVAPHAERMDRDERMTPDVVAALGARGYLGALVPAEYGGRPMDPLQFGSLSEEIGRVCAATRSLVTVHSMVCAATARWGADDQRRAWLPRLGSGAALAAFALTEPDAGSDASAIATSATAHPDGYTLDGRKKWITIGLLADVFLVFAKVGDQPAAFLVARDAPGLSIVPIPDMLGMRGAMIAELELRDCRVAADAIVGPVGFGLSAVAATALDLGRYSVACGCVGLAQACLDLSLAHASTRRQFGAPLKDHQLIRRKIANMIAGVRSARLVCADAGRKRAEHDPDSVIDTCLAKYVAARAAASAAESAVQIHGAAGCSGDTAVARHFRDAQVMRIIEGSTEIQQMLIADHAFNAWDRRGDTT
jgi:hypothetical protein